MDDAFLLTPIGSEMGRNHVTLNMSDKSSPWLLWGQCMDTRAFVAGDLPDIYHVLAAIPLWGEQKTPSFYFGKMLDKSLPFACKRRHIVKLIIKWIDLNAGFWSIFSRLMWVAFANLYPGELATPHTTTNMRGLLRIRELCSNKDTMRAALLYGCSHTSGVKGTPLIACTVFGLLIHYTVSFHPEYTAHARQCIGWDQYRQDVVALATTLRTHSLFAADAFGLVRSHLCKTIKSSASASRVYRIRKRSLCVALKEQFDETLEKKILRDQQNFINDLQKLKGETKGGEGKQVFSSFFSSSSLSTAKETLYKTVLGAHIKELGYDAAIDSLETLHLVIDKLIEICKNAETFYNAMLDVRCKSNILNATIRIQPEDRITRDAFLMLTQPEFGAITMHTVNVMMDLVGVYYNKATPKEFGKRIDKIPHKDFVIVCYYLNMVAMLAKISFTPLDADTIDRTHQAMISQRHHLFEGQDIPIETLYAVSIAPCCQRITTLMGQNKRGDKKVAYDMERQSYVCVHGKSLKLKATDNDSDSDEEDDDDDSDDEDDSNDKDDDDEEGGESDDSDVEIDATAAVLEAQNDALDMDFLPNFGMGKEADLVEDATTKKGKGKKRTAAMLERKAVRNKRKLFSKVPCGQPVLTISLYGRALIWGNTLERRSQIMFCPTCGALHMYTLLNYSASETGLYRCNECAQKELMHHIYRTCAYCQRPCAGTNNKLKMPTPIVGVPVPTAADFSLLVLCPLKDPTDSTFDPLVTPEHTLQRLFFCKTHYRIAWRFNNTRGGVPKAELWRAIKKEQERKQLQYANGIYHKK
jgi:hypothetical protein